ncbi:hypothetical protein [Cysteiniphilum marinum]|uniref:hypothetical protein n=1 Tax=Cysteiniphilum marinum TaxID=2774191 RepID=UPI0019396D09|nr:hypothetical protein [Cysteiniphilum marinum]
MQLVFESDREFKKFLKENKNTHQKKITETNNEQLAQEEEKEERRKKKLNNFP